MKARYRHRRSPLMAASLYKMVHEKIKNFPTGMNTIRKPMLQYNLKFEVVRRFDSIKEAEAILQIGGGRLAYLLRLNKDKPLEECKVENGFIYQHEPQYAF